jgi:hypothetical protein
VGGSAVVSRAAVHKENKKEKKRKWDKYSFEVKKELKQTKKF